MYKLKTSSSIFKRFKITSGNKIFRHKSSKSHLLQKKSSKRKRKLRRSVCTIFSDIKNFKNALPYI
uniref:Large ribosomal subunit protein bL35c n=1 Tax=Taenioma perpusillum TaxID=210852 RepID=A0A1Z1MRM4_9FLOR|nr:ribosomal protein L35 [Taenioma perpusillum]ARW68519.1 ribosomal protein L35 [Taenioma perpusillum]